MSDSIENIGVTLPTKWVKFLQQNKSTPIELALLCAGFKQERKVQKWLLSLLQENIDLGDEQKDLKYAIHIFKSLSHSHFYFPLDDKLALNKSEFWYKNTDMLRHLVSMGFNTGIPSFFVNLYTNELIKKQSKIDNSLDTPLKSSNHQAQPVYEKYKDPRDINNLAQKEKRRNFLNSISKQELTSMIEAGKNPFNTDHTINNSNIDSWLKEKAFAALIKETKQKHWDKWPVSRRKYWQKREVLTHNEFIYLLKEKEPRSLKENPTQFDYFPLEFCVFHDETVRIIEDFRVMKKIIPVYQDITSPYPQIGFKTVDLIGLALSKGINVPKWLLSQHEHSSIAFSDYIIQTEELKNNNTEKPIVTNSKDNELEIFLKSIITDYPEATSKDIIAHCFVCYKGNNSKLEPLKKILAELGVVMDKKGGRRTDAAKKNMKNAPIYKE